MYLHHGDCLDVLRTLDANSVDAIITDPPYGLSFMGKAWDYQLPSIEIWEECIRVLKPAGHLLAFSSARTYHRLATSVEDAGFEIRDQLMWLYGSGFPKNHNLGNGLGTALKPAHEPIILARKPLQAKTIAANLAKYGTGGLNIDKSRVPSKPLTFNTPDNTNQVEGRFPANLIHDGSDEVVELFPETTNGYIAPHHKRTNEDDSFLNALHIDPPMSSTYGDKGSAARYFYCAKPSKKEREGNTHPTIKPVKLMSYLINLITPANGVVLDPFMGSGSTGVAALNDGYTFVGIELDDEYFQIANQRLMAI